MAAKSSKAKGMSVNAYRGDAKSLLAFNFADRSSTKNLAGFTIQCRPDGQQPYYLLNMLRFKEPGAHAQDAKEPPTSSLNAPIHKFRWLHVPGSFHGGKTPFFGKYTYTVTPRHFDDSNSLKPIDPALSVSVDVEVGPFQKDGLALGFTRGFTQSQAFVHHFGLKARIRPANKELLFKTSQISGKGPDGQDYTFKQEYDWLGYTAREQIFAILDEVVNDTTLKLDVFAYDLNEPDVMNSLLQLGKQGRIRIILDNAALHHSAKSPPAEDQFEKLFSNCAHTPAAIKRGKFKRYSHDKIFIVSNKKGPVKVLTGSTNFSVTGLYVNSNHVLVFNDPVVAAKYAEVFEAAWTGNVTAKAFEATDLSNQSFPFSSKQTPKTDVTYSPHQEKFATTILNGIVSRIRQEGKKSKTEGSVLFAVMEIGKGTGPVYPALQKLHEDQSIFSYGISDTTSGVSLYKPGNTKGVLVTGKPSKSRLPPPFDQVPGVAGHQIHHKFIVCGFNGDDPVVYCGSSNLALGGEESNGDNLLAVHDGDVATVFAIEAVALVDHFDFLDRVASNTKGTSKTKSRSKKPLKPKFASKQQEAESAGWFLSTDDKWAEPYFDSKDLHFVDRQLFG
jgi:phosphatidylserine/phosphatidylglycerophosphate/cardiolipin synthase-like enzyme